MSHRCTNQIVTAEHIAALKHNLEGISQDLNGAHAHMTGPGDTVAGDCGCMLSRQGSQSSSSAWSLIHNDASSISSSHQGATAKSDRRPSEGKETCRTETFKLEPHGSATAPRGVGSRPSWRSLFVQPDPLSVPLNDASRLILSDESDDKQLSATPETQDRTSNSCTNKPNGSNGFGDHRGIDISQRQDSVIWGPTSPDQPSTRTNPPVSNSDCNREDTKGASSKSGPEHASRENPNQDGISGGTSSLLPETDFLRQRDSAAPMTIDESTKPEIRYVEQMLQVSRPCTPKNSDPDDEFYSSTPTREARDREDEHNLLPEPIHVSKIRSVSVDAGDGRCSLVEELPERSSELSEKSQENVSAVHSEPFPDSAPGRTLLKANSHDGLTSSKTVKSVDETFEQPTLEKARKVPPQPPPPRYTRRSSVPSLRVPASTMEERTTRKKVSANSLQTVSEKSPAVQSRSLNGPHWGPRKSVDDVLRDRMGDTLSPNRREQTFESPDFVGHKSFYGPGGIDEVTPTSLLDAERILLIVYFWNHCQWTQAEKYLIGHLDSLNARSEEAAVRRVEHLLAVCASLQGRWNEALERFIKVLRTPIQDVNELDDGDCAAAYWLGDIYAMQNRRAEALLAYSIAERGSIFQDAEPSSRLEIAAEQDAVQLGVSKADFKQQWSQEAFDMKDTRSSPSLLDSNIVSVEAAKTCLEKHRKPEQGHIHLKQERTRASYFSLMERQGVHSALYEHMSMKIGSDSFEHSSPWPMPYDPLFCMANVQRGRLLAFECDMLEVFKANPEARLPRPLSLSKIDCFTCNDLEWLITTIRDCLRKFEVSQAPCRDLHALANR